MYSFKKPELVKTAAEFECVNDHLDMSVLIIRGKYNNVDYSRNVYLNDEQARGLYEALKEMYS